MPSRSTTRRESVSTGSRRSSCERRRNGKSARAKPCSSFPASPTTLRKREYGLDRFEQLRRRRMRLRAHRADDRVARFLRQLFHELAPRVLGAHEHDLRRVQTPATPVELLRDPLQVFLDELLDVPLV